MSHPTRLVCPKDGTRVPFSRAVDARVSPPTI